MIRTATSADVDALSALVIDQVRNARIAAPLLALVEAAIARPGEEYECLVATDGAELRGGAVYGSVAGAEGAVRLHLVVGERVGVSALLEAVRRAIAGRGARILVAELAELAGTATVIGALRESGFEDAGRVADYFSPGVDLLLLRIAIT